MKKIKVLARFIYNEKADVYQEVYGSALETEYMRLRHELIEKYLTGDLYDQLNKEFDRIYGKRENYMEDEDYARFIYENTQRLADEFNSTSGSLLLDMCIDPENGDIMAQLKEDEEAKIWLSIDPLD